MKKCLCCYLLILIIPIFAHSQNLRLESTINSIGYYVENVSTISNRVSFAIKFKESSATTWRNGLEPSIVNYANGDKAFAGSLLQLKSNTNYNVEVTIVDSTNISTPIILTKSEITRTEPNTNIASDDTLWISNIGRGNLYTVTNPGALDTLFKRDFAKVDCGTTILCKGGLYNLGELTYQVNYNTAPCNNTNKPIILAGATGEQVVFDGSDTSTTTLYPTWTLYDATNKIYKTTLPTSTSFSTLFIYDTLRLFPYATVYPYQVPVFGTWFYEALTNCNEYFGSGFYRNRNVFYIKLINGENPNGKKITVSKYNSFLSITKAQASYNPKFIIKNIECNHYGKSIVTFNPLFGFFESENDARTISFTDIKNTLIDNCRFHFNTSPLFFNGTNDSTIIQNCTFKDHIGLWNHGAFKNTALTLTGDINFINDDGKYGRGLEKATVFFEVKPNKTTKNIIFRKNIVNGYVSGIAGRQSKISPMQDADIYDNTISNCYDAIDIPGNVLNYRVWNNRISNSPVVFSMIPFVESSVIYGNTGPAYIFRNVVTKLPQRPNNLNIPSRFNAGIYINYNGCWGLKPNTWTTTLKMETGNMPATPVTDIHLYHNTIAGDDSLSYNLYIWQGTWRSIKSKNNNFYSKYNIHNFESVANLSNYPFVSINDNYYSLTNKLGVVNGIHGTLSTCFTENTLTALDTRLRAITGNNDTTKLQIKGLNLDPQFVNYANGDLHLQNNSTLIDKGIIIPNVSDVVGDNYNGNAPDIGAYETNIATAINTINNSFSKVKFFPNPSKGNISLISSKKINTILLMDSQGKIIFTEKLKIPTTIKNLNFSNLVGIYFLQINYMDNQKETIKIIF